MSGHRARVSHGAELKYPLVNPGRIELANRCAVMMARALDWVVAHLDEFDPFKGGREFTIANGQRVTELATMLNSYVVLTGDRASPQFQALLGEARKQQGCRALMDRMMHSPAEFVLFADLYSALRRLGYEDPRQRGLIQRVIDIGYLDQLERVPHRMMDVRLTLEWGGFRHRWDTLEKLCATSILVTDPNALYLDEASVYSLTHVIMFLWGFGTRKDAVNPLSAAQGQRFTHTLSMLLVGAAQQHHWDLLCELLLCWDCMELPVTPVYLKAWDAFIAMQGDDGAVPGPERALEFYNLDAEPDPVKKRELHFAHHYHTTLLAIISAAVHRGRRDATGLSTTIDRVSEIFAAEQAHQATRIREAMLRAHGWLAGLVDRLTDGTAIATGVRRERACLEILVALWLCKEALGDARAFDGLTLRIGRELARCDEAGSAVTAVPAALSLAGAAILSAHHCLPSSLGAFLSASADLLSRMSSPDAVSDLPWCEKRVLLRGMGLHDEPPRLSRDEVFSLAGEMSLASDSATVQALALHVNSFTSFGTQPGTLAPGDSWLSELLVGFATHSFKEYDLVAGGKLLRAAAGLGLHREDNLTPCMEFLLLHQDPEGPFGFFGPVESAFADRPSSDFSLDLDLRLPVALESLWTIAELANTGWRMFSALPKTNVGTTPSHLQAGR